MAKYWKIIYPSGHTEKDETAFGYQKMVLSDITY